MPDLDVINYDMAEELDMSADAYSGRILVPRNAESVSVQVDLANTDCVGVLKFLGGNKASESTGRMQEQLDLIDNNGVRVSSYAVTSGTDILGIAFSSDGVYAARWLQIWYDRTSGGTGQKMKLNVEIKLRAGS